MTRTRQRIEICGAVQGVGFRPFVYRLATDLALGGWVCNSAQGVLIEVEGPPDCLDAFTGRLQQDKPPFALIQSITGGPLPALGETTFQIRHSAEAGHKSAWILPDLAPCPDCLRELFDPANRRFLYPFINCTHCGPRYSIIEGLPYDRAQTTMRRFQMCPACQAEYDNPLDRRFHAQPNACPTCGPALALWNDKGHILSLRHDALREAAEAVRAGAILALKGVGGFQLIVDAANEDRVRELRRRKQRPDKPFAVLYPSLSAVKGDCLVTSLEDHLLGSPEAPIVLLPRRVIASPAPSVAPGNPNLGVMLPASPLHHLLMVELGFPVVATSANLSDEPICFDEAEALERLAGIADLFLVHNRPIARPVDDSVVRVVAGRELVLRRARGYAPLPLHVDPPLPALVAVGGHLKNAVAIAADHDLFLSQHIGDLESVPSLDAFKATLNHLTTLYDLRPAAIACDLHPDYASTRHAEASGLPVIPVQHHYAHVLACMAENGLDGPVLGVAWDGTGYGPDGTIWGGEFLSITESGYERAGHLRPFRLPGGEAAIHEPRRAALGVLYEVFGDDLFNMPSLSPLCQFTESERLLLHRILRRRLNSPCTTSAGRLFDAAASILDLRQCSSFEGQAALDLESAAAPDITDYYSFQVSHKHDQFMLDWVPTFEELVEDVEFKVPKAVIAAKFHESLAGMIVAAARRVGEKNVVLSGGCFQNRYLTERTVDRLQRAGFCPYWHQRIPPNDGGLAVGQIAAAARELRKRSACV